MEIEIVLFGLLVFVALIVIGVTKHRRDVLHGPYIESGLSKRVAAIACYENQVAV